MKKRNIQPATQGDVEEVATMAQSEFRRMREEMATKELVRELNEDMQEGFSTLRKEIGEGFRAMLAAVETVEYMKLRTRIDALESDIKKIKIKVRV